MQKIEIPCVIFAGGKSSRMGKDKALLPFGEYNSLTQYQHERMREIFSSVYISAKSADKFNFTCKVIEDSKEYEVSTPTAGFVSIFDNLHVKRVFVLSVDSPFIDKDTILTLINSDDSDFDATVAKTDSGTHPMCGVYHDSLHVKFRQMLKNSDHRLGKLLKNAKTNYIYFENEAIFTNINHPHEYKSAIIELKKQEKL